MATNIWTGAHASFPSEWPNAGNWNTIGVADRIPETGDDVYFESNAVDCDEVMDQSTIALTSLNIDQSYTGSLGTSSAPLQITSPIVNIGYHNGPGTPAGSPLINLDLGTAKSSVITVSNTGTSADASAAPVKLKAGNNKATSVFADGGGGEVDVTVTGHGFTSGTSIAIAGTDNYDGTYVIQSVADVNTLAILHSWDGNSGDVIGDCFLANSLTVYKGKVEVGTDTDDTTTTFDAVTSSYDTRVSTDTDVFIGTLAASVPTINILGGDVYLDIGAATVNIKDGTLYTTGTGTIATLNVNGGTVTSNSTGIITTLNVFDGSGVVDFTKSNATRTVTTATLDPSGTLKFDDSVLTLTNNVKPYTASRNVTYTAS